MASEKRLLLAILTLVGVLASTSLVQAAEAPPTLQLLPDIGGYATAYAINDRGDAVGTIFDATLSASHAALWQDSQLIDLGTLGGTSATAYAINNRGHIVGASTLSGDTITHAFLWKNGEISDLGCLPNAIGCEARAINNTGEIVGTSFFADGPEHAVKWSNGRIVDLTPNSTTASRALTINNAGVVGGFVQRGDGSARATLWVGTHQRHLDDFGTALVRDINNRGSLLIERYTTDDVRSSAFYLVSRGRVTDLTDQNGLYFIAEALNNHDQVGGRLPDFTPERVIERISVWDNGKLYEAAPLPEPYASGNTYDLNDRGHQAGTVATESGAKAAVWMTTTN